MSYIIHSFLFYYICFSIKHPPSLCKVVSLNLIGIKATLHKSKYNTTWYKDQLILFPRNAVYKNYKYQVQVIFGSCGQMKLCMSLQGIALATQEMVTCCCISVRVCKYAIKQQALLGCAYVNKCRLAIVGRKIKQSVHARTGEHYYQTNHGNTLLTLELDIKL